ncbi:helix-turn-helix domain-containing protein [Streptomyces griseorubiginosus]|uniref:helix-turn-helix domain-containing protein n=1 Tax=Streptomyces griseorubiginosus TaxID=67304 RepID=UPI0011402C46|nr:XRE family transcriptional regulator [Streptomyces griseorubiginosus]
MTPSAPSPPGARLAAFMRELRERAGLSLTRLAAATTYSRSSWERYLNGKSLPPRSAVKELCHLAGEPADHALALLDIARTQRTDGSTPTEEASSGDASAPTPAGAAEASRTPARTGTVGILRRADVVTALASTCAVVIGALVLINLPPLHRRAAPPSSPPATATGALCSRATCHDKDPLTTRCGADPLTLAEHETATGAWIQIRYSRPCGTSWARMWGAAVGDRVEITTAGSHRSRHSARVTTARQADTYVHTLMSPISSGTTVRACFSAAAGDGKECVTARYAD